MVLEDQSHHRRTFVTALDQGRRHYMSRVTGDILTMEYQVENRKSRPSDKKKEKNMDFFLVDLREKKLQQ